MPQLMCLGLQLAEALVRVSLAILDFFVRAFVVEPNYLLLFIN